MQISHYISLKQVKGIVEANVEKGFPHAKRFFLLQVSKIVRLRVLINSVDDEWIA